MKLLIFGADGMIGSGLWRHFFWQTEHDVVAVTRTDRLRSRFPANASFRAEGALESLSLLDEIIANEKPDIILNCVGVTKHVDAGHDPLAVISSNSLLPHLMLVACRNHGSRLVQISTDCVYRGTRGNYRETDEPDANDLYGRSKILGEIVNASEALTIRVSTVGFELDSRRGLLEWFLAQTDNCRGFPNAFFTGLTTIELARLLDRYVFPAPEMHGLRHIAGPRISKYDLLLKFREHFRLDIDIIPDGDFAIDRSLDGNKIAAETTLISKTWDEMLWDLNDSRSREYGLGTA